MPTIITPAPDDPSNDAMNRLSAVHWIDQEHRSTNQTLAQCLRRAASRPWPDLTGRYYSFGTLENWYYTYKHKGLQGLHQQVRKDKGTSRTIRKELGQWITQELRQEPGTIPLTTLYDHWILEQRMPLAEHQKPPHLAAIRRYLKAQGIKRHRPPEARCGATKAFETAHPNDLWMVDFSPGPFMLYHDNIQPKKTHLCVIIDDHSRLVTHAAYYPSENTASFHDCLKCALRKRGVPRKLYTDNGGAFISHHSKQICARIDIELLHHKPYAAWSKGKVEKVIGSIQLGFEAWIRNRKGITLILSDINQQLQHWLDSIYHQRLHRKTGEKPLDRYLPALHRKEIRLLDIESELELERLFYIKTNRKVRADGTIQLGGHYYEVDLSLKGLKVEIRHNPLTNKHIEVWHQDTAFGEATLVDYLINSRRHAPGKPPQDQ
jgi:putative transposase